MEVQVHLLLNYVLKVVANRILCLCRVVEEPELDVENSKFIIAKVGDKFCELVEQEKGAKSWAGDDGMLCEVTLHYIQKLDYCNHLLL